MPAYYPTRTIARRVSPSRVISLRPPAQVFTQGLTASLSFIGSFVASRKFLKSFSAQLFNISSAFDPSTITGLKLWLKADSLALTDGASVNTWTDSSGLNNDFTSVVSAPTFKTNIVNAKPVIRFNGTNQGLSNTTAGLINSASTFHTIFAVVSAASTSAGDHDIFDTGGAGAGGAIYFRRSAADAVHVHNAAGYVFARDTGGIVTGAWNILTADWNGSNIHIWRNGTLKDTTGATTLTTYGVINSVGLDVVDANVNFWDGDIAEILIYNSALSSTDRGNVETYLISKYAISGGGGSAGTLSLRTLKALAATFSPVAALSRRLYKSLAATLTSTAAFTKKYLDAGFTATLSFIGNLAVSKTFVRALSATLSFSGALSRRTGKALSATLSFVGALPKNIRKTLTTALSFVGNFAASKLFVRAFTATLSFVGNLAVSKLFVRAFTATLNFTGVLSRRTGKALAATLSFISDLATTFIAGGGHLFFQSFTATLSLAGAIAKLPRKNFAAALSFIGALTKGIRKAGFTATLLFAGFLSTSKSFLKFLTASLSFSGAFSVSKSFLKALTATLSFSSTFSRRAGKAFSATLILAASLVRRSARVFSATLSSVGTLVKAIRDAGFTATLSFVGALTTAAVHFFTRSFTATLSFVGNLTRSRTFARALAATLNMTGTLRRRLGKTLSAALNFSGALRRAIRKGLAAVLAFAVFFFKGGAVEILAGIVTKAGALIALAGSTARISKAGSQLDVVERGSGAKIQVTGSNLRVERTK